jgi:Transposase IS66 family
MLGTFAAQGAGLAERLDRPMQDFGKKTLESLHTLMETVKDARKKPPDQTLSQLYQEQLDDYRRAFERVEASAPTEKARKLAVEMLSDWDVIFTILDNSHLPLTNNEAERALRHTPTNHSRNQDSPRPSHFRDYCQYDRDMPFTCPFGLALYGSLIAAGRAGLTGACFACSSIEE